MNAETDTVPTPGIGIPADFVLTEEIVLRIEQAVERAARDAGPWLDKEALAERLACSPRWVEYRMVEGLPHTIIAGRVKFRAAAVEHWLTENGHMERGGVDV